MAKVLNKYNGVLTEGAVNIMRPTKWGNPFSHQSGTTAKYRRTTREDAVQAYGEWLFRTKEGRDVLRDVKELRGKDLVCCCAPKSCHGDVLLDLANSEGTVCAICDERDDYDENELCDFYGTAVCRRCVEDITE